MAKEVVGSVCYVGWPYLVEARIQGVSDGKRRIQQVKITTYIAVLYTQEFSVFKGAVFW